MTPTFVPSREAFLRSIENPQPFAVTGDAGQGFAGDYVHVMVAGQWQVFADAFVGDLAGLNWAGKIVG